MATERISWTSGSPTTEFSLFADRVGQSVSGNYTIVRLYIRAYNRGSTSSYSNGSGYHHGWISGWGDEDLLHNPTPFLPSGYSTGEERWSLMREVHVQHGSDGTRGPVTLRMTAGFDGMSTDKSYIFDDFPDIDIYTVPPPPTATTPTDVTTNSVLFNMDNNGTGNLDLDSGQVRYGTDSTGAVVTTITYDSTGFLRTITGLTHYTTYYFWGRVHNAKGWSGWSNRVSVRTLADLPAAPASPSISSITSNSVYASFSNPSDTGGAPILEKQIGYGTSSFAVQYYAAGDSTIGGLARFTVYYFWSRVRNAAGWGPWAAPVSARSKAEVPGVPTIQALDNVTSTSFQIHFTKADDGGDPATSDQIGYGTDPNTPQYFYQTYLADSPLSGLLRNTTYYVWVRAYNADAWSGWSARASIKTLADYPSAPTAVALTNVTQTTVHATFYGGSDDGGAPILEWQIGYGTDPNAPTSFVGYGGDMDISNLDPGIVYYFWARGRNIRGWSAWSARSQVTLIAGARVKVNNVWKNAVPFVRIWGLWIRAQPYVKVDGVWRKTS